MPLPGFQWPFCVEVATIMNVEFFRRHLQRQHEGGVIDPCLSLDSPLRQAVRTGNLARVRELVHRYDINVPNRKKWTLIHESAVSDDLYDVFQCLISAGAKIQFKADGGVTPLYVACRHGSLKIAKVLVEAGCDVNENCQFDYDFNMKIPCNFKALHAACIAGHKDLVALLIEYNADLNVKDSEERTPAYYALKNADILRLLINAGADLVTEDIYGGSILYYACNSHFDPAVFKVLKSSIMPIINSQATNGRTILMDACIEGKWTLAEELIKMGADVTLTDDDGLLPIHMAAASGYKTFKLLLQHTPVNVIEKYSTLDTDSGKWRSLPCCVIESGDFESLILLYRSGLSDAILSCPDEANKLLLSPVAFVLVSAHLELEENQIMKFLKYLSSYEFQLHPAYKTMTEIPRDVYKFNKKKRLKQLMAVEAVIYRHQLCFDNWYRQCYCKLYFWIILSHIDSLHKMLPYGYTRQLDFFCDCARYGFFQALELLNYAEYVNPDDVLKEFLKRLMSDSAPVLVGHEERVIKFLLEKCTTNLMITFLEMKTLALKNLRFGGSPTAPSHSQKYETFLSICRMAESNKRVETLQRICRNIVRKSIQKQAEESKESFKKCLESINMPPGLHDKIRYDIS